MHTHVYNSQSNLNILGVFPLCDPDHPEEFVDVVSGVADHSPKDDEDVVNPQHPHDLVGLLLRRGHGLADQRYVTVVPCVVVDQCSPVGHTYKYTMYRVYFNFRTIFW